MRRRLCILLLLALCVPGCRASGIKTVKGVHARAQAGDLEALRKAWIETNDREIRVAIMEETGRFGGFPRAERVILDNGFPNPDPAIRLAATNSAASFHSPAIVAGLVERLGDDQPPIREAARVGLAKRGAAARPFLNRSIFEHPNPDVRRGCAMLLGKLEPDPESRAALERCREDPHPDVADACASATRALPTE